MRNLQIFICGAVAVTAFAPFNLWWMSIVSLSYCLVLFYSQSQRQGFKHGFIYGLGLFGCGISWLFYSLYDFGQAPLLAAVLMVLALTAYLSLLPALCFYGCQKLARAQPTQQMLIFVVLWVLCEWSRGWLLTGFPWLSFGHSLVDSPLRGVLPVVGTFGGSALIALLAALLAKTVIHTPVHSTRDPVIFIAMLCLCASLDAIDWTQPAARQPLKVAAVQANIPEFMKWKRELREEIYQRHVDASEAFLDHDVIVWPETAIPTFYHIAEKEFISHYAHQLSQHNAEIVAGTFTHQPATEEIYNSMVTISNPPRFYSKQHLVPFGEYLPLRGLFHFFDRLVQIPASNLSPGQGAPLMIIGHRPVGVSICYEAVFGEEILMAVPYAQWLINITNDAWFGPSLAPHQHLQIARVRAAETGRYMVRAANTGISAIIDPKGEIITQSGEFTAEVVHAEIWPMQGQTPFMIWSNWGIICLLLITLLIAYGQQKLFDRH